MKKCDFLVLYILCFDTYIDFCTINLKFAFFGIYKILILDEFLNILAFFDDLAC